MQNKVDGLYQLQKIVLIPNIIYIWDSPVKGNQFQRSANFILLITFIGFNFFLRLGQ